MPKSNVRAASRQTQSRASKRTSVTATVRATSARATSVRATAAHASPGRASAGRAKPSSPAKPSLVARALAKAKGPAKRAVAALSPAPARAQTNRVQPPRLPASPARSPSRVIEVNAPVRQPSAPDALWTAFQAARTRNDTARAQDIRNKLIERYHEVVRFTAERMHTRLPSEVDVNDLISAGFFGLKDAVDAFDPARGVKFETYCAPRIRGAIFDELRSMDWVPRLVRSRTAKVEKVRKEFELTHGRKPTEDEVSARMNVSGAEYDKLSKDSRPVGVVSLDRKAFESDSSREVREVDVIEDGRQPNPAELVQRGDLQALITKGLSRSERLIVILYYYEEMTMKEIGLTLDLSESRVSQMHSSILARLKAQMQHRLKEF